MRSGHPEVVRSRHHEINPGEVIGPRFAAQAGMETCTTVLLSHLVAKRQRKAGPADGKHIVGKNQVSVGGQKTSMTCDGRHQLPSRVRGTTAIHRENGEDLIKFSDLRGNSCLPGIFHSLLLRYLHWRPMKVTMDSVRPCTGGSGLKEMFSCEARDFLSD